MPYGKILRLVRKMQQERDPLKKNKKQKTVLMLKNRSFWLAARFICISKLDGLRVAVHVEGFLLRRAVVSKAVRRDLTVAALRLGLIPGVTERPQVLGGLASVLRGLLGHVYFIGCRCFHQTCLTGPVLRLIGALVTANQSSSQPQAGRREILHVAVVRQRGQKEEEKQ